MKSETTNNIRIKLLAQLASSKPGTSLVLQFFSSNDQLNIKKPRLTHVGPDVEAFVYISGPKITVINVAFVKFPPGAYLHELNVEFLVKKALKDQRIKLYNFEIEVIHVYTTKQNHPSVKFDVVEFHDFSTKKQKLAGQQSTNFEGIIYIEKHPSNLNNFEDSPINEFLFNFEIKRHIIDLDVFVPRSIAFSAMETENRINLEQIVTKNGFKTIGVSDIGHAKEEIDVFYFSLLST